MKATGAEFERRLREALPSASFMSSPAEYAIDGETPALVVSPQSPEAIALALGTASECGGAVVPWGGGTRMALGTPPARYDVALDLAGLDGIVEYEPADLTVTVQAGVRIEKLQHRLAEHGQWLPLDPPGGPTSTVGGLLATNASGPARVAFGTARDLVIGMTVATAGGQLVKSGGRVVKNVAGYDMAKMHIGALGTLGVIVQATFKVAPLPRAASTLSIEAGDAESLLKFAFEVRDRGLPATGIALTGTTGTARKRLLVRFAGSAAAVARASGDLSQMASGASMAAGEAPDTAWTEAAEMRRQGGGAVLRLSHRPKLSANVLAACADLSAGIVCYPTAGLTYACLLSLPASAYAPLRDLRTLLEADGGGLVIESGPLEAKREIEVWGTPRGDFELMRRLKSEMDPKSALNPGRFLGGL